MNLLGLVDLMFELLLICNHMTRPSQITTSEASLISCTHGTSSLMMTELNLRATDLKLVLLEVP